MSALAFAIAKNVYPIHLHYLSLMLDLQTIADFSRANCVGICAFLVPANLLATLAIMIMTALRYPLSRVLSVTLLGCILAVTMILHVYTWFAIGVVMMQTYVLLGLALTCLVVNLGAISIQLTYFPPVNRVAAE